MLRLLIADDERYDRDSIISILLSVFEGMLEISEAQNGREAIEISERIRPEIIIMDIKMPGINGLKAIEEIRKFNANAYFIILTAYDYFDFAVEAVKNNVKEYLLKPFSKKELLEKIEKAINFVNLEKEKRKNEIENQEKLYNLIPILENELSYSIINNTIRTIDFETYIKYLNMDFKNACSLISEFKDSNKEEKSKLDGKLKFKVGDYVRELINRRYKAISSYRFTKELVYFIQIDNFTDENEVKSNLVNIAVDIRREIKRIFDISLRIGIGECYSGLNLMHKSYEEACSCLRYKSKEVNIIHFGDINLNYKDKTAILDRNQNIDKEKITLFRAVEQYIEDNIKYDLNLEDMAAKFNLSLYYFSRTFKEVVGYNFSDYINIKRINIAKDILQKDSISIKEVCYQVGYSDPNYFSKVFKKYEGISPTEFKSKLI